MPGTTWTLSGFGDEIAGDPVVQLAVLQALGASHLEARSAWGVNIIDLDDELLARLADLLRERRMGVSAIASPIGKVDIALPVEFETARLERAVHAAHVLEAPYIRIFSFYRDESLAPGAIRDEVLVRMSALARVAEREGVTLVHENEKGIYGETPARVLDIVESVGSARLRVAWDNANYVQAGIRPYTDGFEMLRPHIAYLQVKDAIAATGQVVPAGEGDGELLETVTALRDDGYSGFASLEPHLADVTQFGAFSGPHAFGRAARAFARLTEGIGVSLV